MKKTSLLTIVGLVAIAVGLIAADHLDAMAVGGTTADITDFYAFEGANPDNTVFVANVQSSLAAGDNAQFDENVLVEINIDNNGDLIEDLVIQAIPRDGIMYFFGPYTPNTTGLNSTINPDTIYTGEVMVSQDSNAITETSSDGISYFAGLREDPFFFDFNQFNAVIGGMAPNGFNNPGNDDFDGTNVLSIVVEVPNQLLGGTFPHPAGTMVPVFNTWVEAKRKQ